jgi:hypothetical protein
MAAADAAAIYREQKVLPHFLVCCWIAWLLMIKNCPIESGPPCRVKIHITVDDQSWRQAATEPQYQILVIGHL